MPNPYVVGTKPNHLPSIHDEGVVSSDVGPPPLLVGSMNVAFILNGHFQHDVGKIGPADPATQIVEDVGIHFKIGEPVVV